MLLCVSSVFVKFAVVFQQAVLALTDHIGWSFVLQLLDRMSQARWGKPGISGELISVYFCVG